MEETEQKREETEAGGGGGRWKEADRWRVKKQRGETERKKLFPTRLLTSEDECKWF